MSDLKWCIYLGDKLMGRFSDHLTAVSFVQENYPGVLVRIVGPDKDYELRWNYIPDDAWAAQQRDCDDIS